MGLPNTIIAGGTGCGINFHLTFKRRPMWLWDERKAQENCMVSLQWITELQLLPNYQRIHQALHLQQRFEVIFIRSFSGMKEVGWQISKCPRQRVDRVIFREVSQRTFFQFQIGWRFQLFFLITTRWRYCDVLNCIIH